MKMPSADEMTTFAKSLPPIYRDVMAAYPAVEPERKAGYGLAYQTLAMHFANTGRSYSLGDVQEACQQLADNGFLEIKNGIFAHPTDLGEQLITALTGKPAAARSSLPRLPARTW
jgi:hypothetical protein